MYELTLDKITAEDIEHALILTFAEDGEDYPDDYEFQDYEHFEGWDNLSYDMLERQEFSYPRRIGGETQTVTVPYRPARDTLLGFKLAVSDQYGGEGQGDTLYIVISLSDGTNTRYFRKDGFYASYDGSTWDGDFREVTPVERTVTFYE